MKKSDILKALEKVGTSTESNIVSGGLVRNIQIFGDEVIIDAESVSPTLQAKKKLEVDIMTAIHNDVNVKAKIIVHVTVSEKAKEVAANVIKGASIPGVKSIIAIASGKGGVGKSTVTANLAVTLHKMGFKVGLIDADIYGPSAPLMFDIQHAKPLTVHVDGKNLMGPVEGYGVKLMSIGFFANTDQAVVWRGPMATKALTQMIHDTHWGELDFLLIDLPPGTGDIHLSMVQNLPVTGAVIVSTPQKVALADARKGVAMFKMEQINVPVLGILENMSYFSPPEQPEKKYYLFGKEGAQKLAKTMEVPFLGELPLIQSIREAGDVGRPAALQEGTNIPLAFDEIARNIVGEVAKRNKDLPPTEIVRITTMAGCSPKK
ncbi:MAG: Mrp/NBP35 family ATP-binding protein [Schleiferiaceae bacterium]|jgi:ATP-binding protein involved in chromosome partitioning|tara:strand:- start:2385 stop:3512 length:1128 start_codon:yes stop_codon:yes gene_type:complete